jgi:hypothetical protein
MYCKMGNLSDFQRVQIVDARLAAAPVNKKATLLGASGEAISKFMMPCTNLGKTSPAKKNSDRKPKLSERDSRTL